MMTSFLITGATGNVGAAVLAHLAADEHHLYTATLQKDSISKTERWLDFERPDSFPAALQHIDVLFLLRPLHLADVRTYFAPFIADCQRAGMDVPSEQKIVRAVAGIRYLLPFLIDSEVKVDALGNVRFQLSGEQQLLNRLILTYQTQWLVSSYTRLRVDLDYLLTKNLALFGNYDTRYNTVGGLSYRF